MLPATAEHFSTASQCGVAGSVQGYKGRESFALSSALELWDVKRDFPETGLRISQKFQGFANFTCANLRLSWQAIHGYSPTPS